MKINNNNNKKERKMPLIWTLNRSNNVEYCRYLLSVCTSRYLSNEHLRLGNEIGAPFSLNVTKPLIHSLFFLKIELNHCLTRNSLSLFDYTYELQTQIMYVCSVYPFMRLLFRVDWVRRRPHIYIYICVHFLLKLQLIIIHQSNAVRCIHSNDSINKMCIIATDDRSDAVRLQLKPIFESVTSIAR